MMWECKCGWRISDTLLQALRFDVGCPRCFRSLGYLTIVEKKDEKKDKKQAAKMVDTNSGSVEGQGL